MKIAGSKTLQIKEVRLLKRRRKLKGFEIIKQADGYALKVKYRDDEGATVSADLVTYRKQLRVFKTADTLLLFAVEIWPEHHLALIKGSEKEGHHEIENV